MADTGRDPKLDEVKAVLRRLQRMSPESEGRDAVSAGDATTEASPSVLEAGVLQKSQLDPFVPIARPIAGEAPLPSTPSGYDQNVPMPATPQRRRLIVPALAVVGVLTAVIATISLQPRTPPAAVPETAVVAALPTVAMPKVAPKEEPRAIEPAPSGPQPEIGPVHEPPPAGTTPRSDDDVRVTAAVSAAGAELALGKVRDARERLSRVLAHPSPDVALLLGRTYDPTVLREIADADATGDPAVAAKWYRTWHERAAAQGLVRDTRALDRLLRALN